MKYHSNDTVASDPVNITLSHTKLKLLRPDLYGLKGVFKRGVRKRIEEHIFYGDSQPAIVVSIQPLLIAAYSDELDCIAMIKYPQEHVNKFNLEEKTRLLTINTYRGIPPYQGDLLIGKNKLDNWYGFHPIIAEFVSEDIDKIQKRKQIIDEALWEYIYDLGLEYKKNYKNIWRDGRPIFSENSFNLNCYYTYTLRQEENERTK